MQLRALVDAGVLTREEAETMAQGSLTPPRMKPWPTPTVCGNYNRKGASATSGDGLATVVGGALNPTWVEWLMGWPLGWTDLKPLATDKFHSAPQQLGGY